MEEYWREIGFELIWTGDGSPSLKPVDGFESMHHRGGAWSETREIYGKVVEMGLQNGARRVMSVGLGLGYNELVTASAFAKCASDGDLENFDFELWSFESDPRLVREFTRFVENPQEDSVYQKILSRLENPAATLETLRRLKARGNWKIHGRLEESSLGILEGAGIEIFLFDAYSSKTSPELWSEEFLRRFLKTSSSPERALFSTYACTGHLKRALLAEGFTLTVRPGFLGKRNSTLGERILAKA